MITKKTTLLYSLVIITFCSLFFSCEKIFMRANPETTPTAIFEEYWKIVNEKFAMFEDPTKNLDRNTLYTRSKTLVNDQISSDRLGEVLGAIVITLKDGHSSLTLSSGVEYSYDNVGNTPLNLDVDLIDRVYLAGKNVKTSGDLSYTVLDNGNAGYIAYRDFESKITDDLMNTILTEFSNTKGIIIDVRGNGGGNPAFAGIMASHFTSTTIYTGYERFKTGPGINDFSNSPVSLIPANQKGSILSSRKSSHVIYTKPVYVLTNIECYSATTTLCYLLNPLAHVTFVGARTGGGSGSVADGYLANGWKWSLSTSEFIDYKGNRLDAGFDPDILVSLNTADNSKDEIIDKAIEEIRKK